MEREKKLNTADKNVSTMDDLNEKCKRKLFSDFKSVQMAKYKRKKEKKKEKQAEKKVKKKSSQRKERKAKVKKCTSFVSSVNKYFVSV